MIRQIQQELATNSHILVAACTYKRPQGLERLLGGLAAQVFEKIIEPYLQILIVDNEASDDTKVICDRFCEEYHDIPLSLVVENTRGISFARNTVIDHVPADCDFLVMIDDDELPDTHWLENLLLTQRETGYEIVRGPDVPVYPQDTPKWVIEGEYFGWPGNRSNLVDGQTMSSSSTSNVLLKYDCLKDSGVRFDTRLSLTGGEDVVFFNDLKRTGCRIAYSAKAVVREFIPDSRLTRMALIRLSYRYGNNKLAKQLRLHPSGVTWVSVTSLLLSLIVSSIRHIVMGLANSIVSLVPFYGKRDNVLHGVIRSARGVGQLTSILGISYKYYK